ncbi:MAG: DUF459 domain-containing protein, partial [Microvirga sp.]
MKIVPILQRTTLALLLAAGGIDAALAQTGYYQQQPGYRDPRAYPPGYYPGKLVQPAQPQQQQGFSIRRFFGVPDEPPPAARAPVARPRKPAAPPAAVAKQEKPKVDPSTHVVVFGDALASYARQGLDAHLADNQDVAVVSKVRNDTSLARTDPADWPNFIKATLDGGQKTSVAVMMLGANDRQSIRDGEEGIEPLSDRWKELYRQRIDAIMAAFKERKVPVVWIGLPPMKSSKISEDLLAMNEIYKESVQRNGGVYVDIWPGFVDEENRYTAEGPDVDGEPTKLRTNEGIFFTRAGARKVAFFADTEIKRILGQGGTATAATPNPAEITPADGSGTPSVEAALPPPPDAATPVILPSKPLIGPVLPLTRQDVTPGGTLVSAPPKLTGDHAYPVQRALRVGIAPGSRPGRADDFR